MTFHGKADKTVDIAGKIAELLEQHDVIPDGYQVSIFVFREDQGITYTGFLTQSSLTQLRERMREWLNASNNSDPTVN